MDTEAIKKILDKPEGQELVKFIALEALKLDSVSDIKLDDPVEATIELKARIRAYD